MVDIDGDEKFTASDFLTLDEHIFTEKSSKVYQLTQQFENLIKDQLGNLKKVNYFNQI